MGWQTLRQMGEAALGRQSNHIHLACFPFPLFMCSAATYQQAGAKEPGIITSHTPAILQIHTCTKTFPEVHSTPAISPLRSPPLTCTSGFSLPSNTTLILRAHILHLLEEQKEVRKEFCGRGNIYLNLDLLISKPGSD